VARTLRRDLTEAQKAFWQMLLSLQIGYRLRRQIPIGQLICRLRLPRSEIDRRDGWRPARVLVGRSDNPHSAPRRRGVPRVVVLEQQALDNPKGTRIVIAENYHQGQPTQTLPHEGPVKGEGWRLSRMKVVCVLLRSATGCGG
jgi:hypothetical protein